MNNVSDILKLANQAQSEQIEAVLATVVHTEGSAYRKAGAMMLICADGRSAGMISGGCLEPHIIKKAFWLTRQGPVVQVYQTGEGIADKDKSDATSHSDEHDIENSMDSELELNFGLGCNGRVHVLFERLAFAAQLLQSIKQVRLSGEPMTVATLVRSESSDHPIGLHVNLDQFVLNKDSMRVNDFSEPSLNDPIHDPILSQAVNTLCLEQYQQNPAQFVTLQGAVDNSLQQRVQTQWLVRHLQPQIKLLICGAGNDVMPLVTMAKMQDWHVTVIDSRSHYATRSRFMQADKVLCLPLEDSETLIELSRNAAVAVMSHSLSQDRVRLKVLFAHPPAYLGQLGPSYRTERLINEITEAYDGNDDKLQAGIEQLHYPIGYKLGGEGPEALALGIMAQISAVLYGKDNDDGNEKGKQSDTYNTLKTETASESPSKSLNLSSAVTS